MQKSEKYWFTFCLAARQSIKDYNMLIGLSLFMITCLVVFAFLWEKTQGSNSPFQPHELLWYIVMNEIILTGVPNIHLSIEREFHEGRISYFLPRPMSYLGSKIAEGSGTLFVQFVVLSIVGCLFTWVWTRGIPADLFSFALVAALGFVAGFVGLLFKIMVGVSCFWLQAVSPCYWIYEKLLFLFGGLFLPLSLYPPILEKIAYYTPFYPILGGRSALVVGASWHEFGMISLLLLLWGALATIGLLLLYRRALKILNTFGG